MKKRHLFSAMALAAVFAGCSQEELISENNFQDAVDRPEVEAPVITLGTDTRMTTDGSYAKVTWEEGDGFGAMLMDEYVPGGTGSTPSAVWQAQFPIKPYVSSNILYKTEDGKSFFADASLKQGNYLFYAPFNKENFKREPLAVKLPLVQNVVPSADAPSNTAIKEFYESGTSPVFVAYDSIWNTPKTELELSMKHIYALPKITLKLGKVQLLDENGKLNVDADKKPVYETSIAIDSIKFTNTDDAIVTAGTIKNQELISKIGKNAKGEVAWDKAKYENAATADIVKPALKGADEAVWVKFNPALTITSTKNGEFFMVLPGAEYTKENLAVEVYTTINGKAYVSAVSSDGTSVKTIKPAKNVRLLPGLPYSADEYNADGTMKESKGTSATYTVEGGFIPAETAISGYTEIKSYEELINFIQNVAYRGEPLIEMAKAEAELIMKNNVIPDPKKYFVITVDEKTPIELDDNFVTVFKNSCVITGKNGTIAFKTNNNQVTLGDITYSTDDPIAFNAGKVIYNTTTEEIEPAVATLDKTTAAYVTGNVVLKGSDAPKFGVLEVKKNASVAMTADLKYTTAAVCVKNMGGMVTVETEANVDIQNEQGTAVVNKVGTFACTNGPATDPVTTDNVKYYAEMSINAANVTVTSNTEWGKVNVSGNATVTFDGNDGLVVAGDQIAKITVTAGSGKVDNTANGKITNNAAQTVFATIAGSNGAAGFAKYDELSGLTKIVLTGAWNVNGATENSAITALFAAGGALNKVKEIDFNAGSSLYVGGSVTLDLSTVTAININADVNWTGRSIATSKVSLGDTKENVIKYAKKADGTTNYVLTETDIDIVEP